MHRVAPILLVVAGCAHASADRAPIVPIDKAAISTVGPATIAWTRISPEAVLPTTSVEVADHAMPLVLDTGASTHMIVSGVAWYLSMHGQTESVGVLDAHGDRVPLSLLTGVQFQVVHWQPLPPAGFVVGDMPVGSRLMGFISPQALVGDGGAVLNFPASQMTAVRHEDLAAALAKDDAEQAAVECGPSPGNAALFMVQVDIDGTPVSMVLDTGSSSSTLFGRSPTGQQLATRAVQTDKWMASLGGTERLSKIPDATISVGGREVRMPLGVIDRVAPPLCAGSTQERRSEGVLGMDVLRGCAVVVTSAAASVRCT